MDVLYRLIRGGGIVGMGGGDMAEFTGLALMNAAINLDCQLGHGAGNVGPVLVRAQVPVPSGWLSIGGLAFT